MNSAARLVTAIATITMVLSASPTAADLELDDDPLSHRVTVVNATADQHALVDWALVRYEAAGLPLPAMTITFHTDSAGCHEYLGYYDPNSRGLEMCNWGQHHKITTASTLLHELAHAWSFEYMTEAKRAVFVEHRGLNEWHHDGRWWDMGQEQAAEIIAWGIGGSEFVSVYLHEDCSRLAASYSVATGKPGPNC